MDGSKERPQVTAGLDLGDNYSYLCLIDTHNGEVLEEGRLRTTPEALRGDASFLSPRFASRCKREPTRPELAGSWRSAATRFWWPMLANCG
jgi:hypothetical protein